MQPLLDPPRQLLDTLPVTALLQSNDTLQITYGARFYNAQFLLQTNDLAQYMLPGSTVESDITATVHRSCTFVASSDITKSGFDYLTDFVQPYMVLTNPDTGYSAQFNLGVYLLSTPTFDNSVTPTQLSFQGYDLLYLLEQPIGDSYEIAAGQDPVAAAAVLVSEAFPAASVQYLDTTEVTSAAMSWPLDESDQTTYLDVINALLAAAGYAPVWVDWNGNFQLLPYVAPDIVSPEWTFSLTAGDNIVAEPRSSMQDMFDVPNWWRFVMTNLTAAPVEGVTQFSYVDDTGNPGSYANRKRYVKKIMYLDATSYSTLYTQGIQQIMDDLNPAEAFAVQLSPFPLLWHRDVVQYSDPNIATLAPENSSTRVVMVTQWSLDLTGQTDMEIVWQTIGTTGL